jgi:hypothetical protein
MAENKIITCIECCNLKEFCFCFCPYCGETYGGCKCNYNKSSFNEKKITINSDNQILISLNSSFEKQDFVNDSESDYARLEKWHIGRANFP